MKNIILGILILNSFLAEGQEFISGTFYLLAKSEEPTFSTYALGIIGKNKDSTFMNFGRESSINKVKYTLVGERLYMEDSLLFFDFSSKEGDTVVYKHDGLKTEVYIDSVRNLQLENKKLYKHFFVRRFSDGKQYTIIQGIGEKQSGLSLFYREPYFENNSKVISVCRNDSLIYWDTYGDTYYDWEGEIVEATCNYYRLRVKPYVKNKYIAPLKIYPNPAEEYIYIDKIPVNTPYNIISIDGKTCSTGIYRNGIDVQFLEEGVYFLNVGLGENEYRLKFVKM